MLLQQTYRSKLDELLGQRQPLPDLFGEKLAITAIGSSETRLRELGERHKALIGVRANWVGTYHHGAKRLIKRVQILSSPTSHIISLKVYGATFFRFDAYMPLPFGMGIKSVYQFSPKGFIRLASMPRALGDQTLRSLHPIKIAQ